MLLLLNKAYYDLDIKMNEKEVKEFLPRLEDTGTSPTSRDGTTPEEVAGSSAVTRRRRMPKTSYKKSRNGCYNCKKRKVKCQETFPACQNCERLRLQCLYPSQDAQSSGTIPNSLQSGPCFTHDDMRFFQHFILTAYPSLPFRGHAVWNDIAKMAHSVSPLKSRHRLDWQGVNSESV
jgi:hypothetical protein